MTAVIDFRSWEGRERKIRAQVEGRETVMVQGAEYGLGFYRKDNKGWQTKVTKEGGDLTPSLRCPRCLDWGLAFDRCSIGNF